MHFLNHHAEPTVIAASRWAIMIPILGRCVNIRFLACTFSRAGDRQPNIALWHEQYYLDVKPGQSQEGAALPSQGRLAKGNSAGSRVSSLTTWKNAQRQDQEQKEPFKRPQCFFKLCHVDAAGRRYSSYMILITFFLDVSAMVPTWLIDVSYMVHIWFLDGSRIFPICSCMFPTCFPYAVHLIPIARFLLFPMCFPYGFFTFPKRFLYGSYMFLIAWCLYGSVS